MEYDSGNMMEYESHRVFPWCSYGVMGFVELYGLGDATCGGLGKSWEVTFLMALMG